MYEKYQKRSHNFLLRVKNLCAPKFARPVSVILIHPNVDYAGNNVLLTIYVKGGFGVVYKGTLQQDGKSITVAVKELRLKDDKTAIYDFQHEFTIMR